LIESIQEAVSIYVGREGHLVDYNTAFKRLFGYTDEELKNKTFLDFAHPDDRAMVLQKYKTKYPEAEFPLVYEMRTVDKNGRTNYVELSVSPYKKGGKVIGVEVTHRDLTERKKMEEEIKASEKELRNLFESVQEPVGIFVGKEGHFMDCNTSFKKMFGYTDEELKNKTFLDFVHPDDRAMVMEKYRTKYPEEELPLVYEVRAVNKKGEIISLEIRAGPYEKRGRAIGIEVILRDITERKKMEEELRDSEERLRTLYENIPDPLAVYVGREGRLLEYNKAFRDHWLGYTDEELKDKNFLSFIHPDDQAMILEEHDKKYTEKDFPLRYEIKAVNKKGEIHPFEISVGQYKKQGKVIGIEILHRDITMRKEMERKLQEYAEHLEDMVNERTKELRESQERLIRSEKLAVVGQLAGAVGHDLRSPLSAIQNACYYLKMKLGYYKDEKVKNMFGVMDKEIKYANNIVTDLMDFSRVRKPYLKKIDLIESIQAAVDQLKLPENVTLTRKFSEIPAIEADPDQLRRVFQNLALNGAQAMSNGGELTISTRKNGDLVEVSVTDTGVGIPEENMNKLFTPLFTTKAQGVGLGLSICQHIVESHNGHIGVKSKVGEGTTFTVELPIHQNKEG
jgi:PAS domain S-box-containing protein